MKDWMSLRGAEKRHAYYCSPEWKALTQAVHARAGSICEWCERCAISEVHHKTYIRLYRENIADLVGLCRVCHQYAHGRISESEWHEHVYDSVPLEPAPRRDDGIPAAYTCAECGAADCDFIGHSKPKVFCDSCAVKLDDRRRGDVA